MTLAGAALLLAGGLVAGIVNTVAGGGSLLALPLLMFVGGMGAVDANGTNRLGVLFGSVTATRRFAHQGALPRAFDGGDAAAACVGALAGAWLSLTVQEAAFRQVTGGVLLAMLILLLARPADRLGEADAPRSRGARTITYLGVGLYGGFIQAGVGVLLASAGVLVSGLRIADAHAAKVAMVLLFTLPALAVFWWTDHVRWFPGLLLAIGSGVGGAWGARLTAWLPPVVLKGLLVVAVTTAAVRLLLPGG